MTRTWSCESSICGEGCDVTVLETGKCCGKHARHYFLVSIQVCGEDDCFTPIREGKKTSNVMVDVSAAYTYKSQINTYSTPADPWLIWSAFLKRNKLPIFATFSLIIPLVVAWCYIAYIAKTLARDAVTKGNRYSSVYTYIAERISEFYNHHP